MTMEVRIIRVEGCESRFGYDRSWTQGLRDLLVCTYYAFAMVLSLPSYCLCHRAVLLHLPCSLVLSCCLLYLRYRDVFAMVLSLLRAVLVIVFLPSCFIVLSFSSCCFWCRTVFVMCCAVFGIGRAVQGIALSLSSG